MKNFNQKIKNHWAKILSVFFFVLLLGAYANIFAIGSKYAPGTTLDPACIPGEINCTVEINSGGVTVDSFNNSVYTETLGSPNVRNSILLGYNVGLGLDLEGTEYSGSNFIGYEAGLGAEGAGDSNFIGTSAGGAASYAPFSNFIGYEAGDHAYYASNSNFIGNSAGKFSTQASNSIFIGNNAGNYDNVDNTINNLSSILIGSFTNTGGFSNSILLGSGMSGFPISNTKANQFMLAPSLTEMRLRDIDYTLPASQGGASTVLTNDGSGGLTWSTVVGDGSMIWPTGGAGIPNYSGSSSWGTSYTTSGSGTALALTNSPVLITPTLGVASATSINNLNFSATPLDFNTKVGKDAGLNIVSGAIANTFLGHEAGRFGAGTTNAADYNTGIGTQSLFSNTTGHDNTGVGAYTFYYNTTGYNNTANGSSALGLNTTGHDNVAIGAYNLYYNNTGFDNTGVGSLALQNNTSGIENTAIGSNSLFTNTTSSFNTAVGAYTLPLSTGANNTAIGNEVLNRNTTGFRNTGLGSLTLYNTTTGNSNTASGFQSLYNNTTGSNNVAMGIDAGLFQANGTTPLTDPENSIYIGANTKGFNNSDANAIVIGYNAIGNGANTATIGNTSLLRTYLTGVNLKAGTATAGTAPLKFIAGTNLSTTEAGAIEYDGSHLYFTATNGGTRYQLDQQGGGGLLSDADFNTKGGTGAGLNLVSGAQANTFLGYEAGRSSPTLSTDTADNNTAIGQQSFYSNTTGSYNSTIGISSLRSNTTGRYNSALGASSLQLNSTGSYNTATGSSALTNNTTGSNNTANGNSSFFSNNTGSSNTASGYFSLYSSRAGSNGVSIGAESQYYANNTTTLWTNYNTSVGYQALRGSTTAASNTGNYNTAIGYQSLMLNSTGEYNTAIGHKSLMSNTTGRINTAIGYQSLMSNTTGYSNTAIGVGALESNTTGRSNTAIGSVALTYNTTGIGNTAYGDSALVNNLAGDHNTSIGALSLVYNNGSSNTAIGYGAGSASSVNEFNVNSSNSIFLGYDTKAGGFGGNTNEIVVGYTAEGRGSNTAQWGNTSMTNHYFSGNVQLSTYGAGTLTTDASGNITASSDERLKDIEGDFNNDNDALSIISSINPILYKWNDESGFDQTTLYAGFSAQNIKDYIPEAVGLDKNGYLTLSDRPILATTVNAIKELDLKVKDFISLDTSSATSLGRMIKDFIENEVNRFEKIFAKTVVTEGIEMKDTATGEDYCVVITNGEFEKVKGKCGEPVEDVSTDNSSGSDESYSSDVEQKEESELGSDVGTEEETIEQTEIPTEEGSSTTDEEEASVDSPTIPSEEIPTDNTTITTTESVTEGQ